MRRALFAATTTAFVLLACSNKPSGGVDAAAIVQPPPTQTAAPTGTCLPCSANAPTTWIFTRQFADATCKKPIAHAAFDACADFNVPAQINVSFGDTLGPRRAGQSAQVNKTEDVAPNAGVYRINSDNQCVPADTAALKLVPAGCAGKKVCRNDAGDLVCDGCRTLSTGCPAYEQALARVVFEDKGAGGGGGGGGGNAERLRQCCNALKAQAKQMGNPPEFGAAIQTCDSMVAALGPNGNAPELGAIKNMLAGKTVPAICAGF